mmetsp:Transcript_22953/g.45877  ORF Transcript_22953/g.45877 Transcript_22953/m.45877 type:complete len:153 (+) Transcript_22953:155-613(+)
MSSKIPSHLARELRRHVLKKSSSAPSSSKSSSSFSQQQQQYSIPKVLAGCLTLTATMTIIPYYFLYHVQSLSERDSALTASQIRRGPYINSGSKDVGKDPYWDFKKGRRKKLGEDGCEDDGGYVDLFKRDDPREVELGDGFKRGNGGGCRWW